MQIKMYFSLVSNSRMKTIEDYRQMSLFNKYCKNNILNVLNDI